MSVIELKNLSQSTIKSDINLFYYNAYQKIIWLTTKNKKYNLISQLVFNLLKNQ